MELMVPVQIMNLALEDKLVALEQILTMMPVVLLEVVMNLENIM